MNKNTKVPLTLHHLLADLSFWGTSVRLMLFAFLASGAFALSLSEAMTSNGTDKQIMLLIYALGSFVLLDFGYVMVARAYPLKHWLDAGLLAVADIIMALLYILPRLIVSPSISIRIDPLTYVFFMAITIVAMRMLTGLLFTSGKRK